MDGPAMAMELPRYRCHKIVRAAKITGIAVEIDESGARLHFGEIGGFKDVDVVWLGKHGTTDMVGGYYVVYDDGYTSFSPGKAFEEGYTIISDAPSGG